MDAGFITNCSELSVRLGKCYVNARPASSVSQDEGLKMCHSLHSFQSQILVYYI